MALCHSLTGTEGARDPNVFHGERGRDIFYFKMISVNTKDSNYFHSPVLELKRFIRNGAAFVSPRPIPNPAGK